MRTRSSDRRFADHTQIPTRSFDNSTIESEAPDNPGLSGARPDATGAITGATRVIRHFLTGELVTVPASPSGRTVIVAGGKSIDEVEKVLPRRNYNRVLKPISIAPEQATPERIARENADAKKHGTGAVYDSKGLCHIPTRGSQNRELKRLGKMNNDASYNDYAGR